MTRPGGFQMKRFAVGLLVAAALLMRTPHASGMTISEFPIPTADSGVNFITAAADGAPWFTGSGTNQIGRISEIVQTPIAAHTPTAPSMPTATAAPVLCVGDCNGNGTVDIADLILGVNIALGAQPVTACEAFADADNTVTISQLIRGVNNALNGCPATPTATVPGESTPTSTPVSSGTPTDNV